MDSDVTSALPVPMSPSSGFSVGSACSDGARPKYCATASRTMNATVVPRSRARYRRSAQSASSKRRFVVTRRGIAISRYYDTDADST
jgi:hypothetical protein